MWESAVLTNAGRDLLAQWAAGGELTIDNADCGQGTVNEAYLMGQTQLVAQKKQLSIVRKANVAQGVRLQLQCTNEDVAEQFTINQIGVWAHLDDGASVMIAIYQDSTGVLVPSAAEMADYVFTFYATLQMSNTGELTVTIDSSALVSMGTFSGLEGKVDDILDGTTTVPKATHAASADSATNATNATNANYATSAGSASTATNAGHATTADSATSAASATTAETANKVANALTFGSKTYNGSVAQTLTAADLGIGAVMYAAGSYAFANLPEPSESTLGAVYNVSDAFTTDSRFKDGAGLSFPAGTNVCVAKFDNVYMFDVYSGFIDTSNLMNKPTIEQYNIAASAWTSLSNADPFTVQATVTATTTIGADAIIELYNDQPVAFATYAFSIASVSGQTITFYALEAPTAQVTLTVGITN